MKIEIRRDYILVDGIKTDREIFEVTTYSKRDVVRELDFRKSNLKDIEEIEIINKSGKNYSLISTSHWHCTLRTSEKIMVKKGRMEYMSQQSC